jgi:hypothetical protein
MAGNAILCIIDYSPEFDGQTRKWAQDQKQALGEPLMEMLPEWWKENEAFFVARDYKSVKPGADLWNPYAEKIRAQFAKFDEQKAEAMATAQAAAQVDAGAPSSAVASKQIAENVSVQPHAVIGFLLVLLATGVWLYSRHARA